VAKDVPLEVIFKGVLPMLIALLLCNLIILFFPQIALVLPNLMR
jgi:TRAP-type C4-dicarboxylate transport system permease large subunit